MTGNEQISGGGTSRRWFLPVMGLFAAGLVYGVLPQGAFGTYDVAARAAVAGAVAGVTTLLLSVLTKRRADRYQSANRSTTAT
jgi:membrane associated rhomboid family serine protease